MGPEHFTSPAAEIDLRVGGRVLFAMRDPEGKDYWTTGTYREIVPGSAWSTPTALPMPRATSSRRWTTA